VKNGGESAAKSKPAKGRQKKTPLIGTKMF
jgi:hypothetical protein